MAVLTCRTDQTTNPGSASLHSCVSRLPPQTISPAGEQGVALVAGRGHATMHTGPDAKSWKRKPPFVHQSAASSKDLAILTCTQGQMTNPGSADLHSCTNRLPPEEICPLAQLLIPSGQPTRQANHGRPPKHRTWRSAWGPGPPFVRVGTWDGRAAACNPCFTGPHSFTRVAA